MGLLDGVEVLAREVLGQRELQPARALVDLAHQDGDFDDASLAGGEVAALPGDQPKLAVVLGRDE